MDRAVTQRILERAVEKGLISFSELAVLQTDASIAETLAKNSSGWGTPIEALLHRGRLDLSTVEALARELENIDTAEIDRSGQTLFNPDTDEMATSEQSSFKTIEKGFSPPRPFKASQEIRQYPVQDWDRYEFVDFIGKGGMGSVFKMRDPRLKRYVAVKFICGDDPSLLERFAQEAQAQARIEHEHICKVFEVGEVKGQPFIAMQYVDGQGLNKAKNQLTLEQKVKVIKEIAEALQAAHRLGLIHRDIKPANIMIEWSAQGNWRPYLMDFGLVREIEADGQTKTGIIVGTPAYMAPEQVKGRTDQLDRRADIYSLGATLFELLSGRPPFHGPTGMDLMLKALNEEPVPIRKLNGSVPADLETIVMKCLEKRPEQRYDSARALADDLQRYLDGEPILARRASLYYRASKYARKQKALVTTITIAALIAILLTGAWLQARWTAAERARLAQEFGQDVKEIESLLRYSYTLPLHNTGREEQMIKQQLGEVETRMRQLGKVAEGPGFYALGRGHFALREDELALQYLQHAWDVGYQTPDTGYALGEVMGQLYKRNRREALKIPNQQQRELRIAELKRQYCEPALQYLKISNGIKRNSPAYIEGTIAYFEDRYELALEKARQAFAESPWLYEAKRLEGSIYLTMGQNRSLQGDYQQALNDYQQAGAAFDVAIEIARSDYSLYELQADRYARELDIYMMTGKDPQPVYEQILNFSDKALQANSNSDMGYAEKTYAYARWGENQLNHGEQPTGFDLAFELAEKALALNPKNEDIYTSLGIAYNRKSQYEIGLGIDPQQTLNHAIEVYEQAMKLNPGSSAAIINIAAVYWRTALYQMGRGIDVMPASNQAINYFTQALKLSPRSEIAYNYLGNTYEIIGEAELAQGKDPRQSLQRTVESYQQAIEINPNFAYAMVNLGITNRTKGKFELRSGLDPRATLNIAVDYCKKGIKINPFADAYRYMSEAYLLIAEYQLEQQLDPTETFQLIEAALTEARKINPGSFHIYMREAQLQLLIARYQLSLKASPGDAFNQADRAIAEALKLNSINAEVYQVAAELCYRKTSWQFSRAELDRGLAMATKALSINPELGEALAMEGALNLVQARETHNAQLAARAKTLFETTLKKNPLLARNYRSLIAEAELLIGNN